MWKRPPTTGLQQLPEERKALAERYTIDADEAQRREQTAAAEAARRVGRVLRNDPGTGVMRHADAGYDAARRCARENGLDLPMIG